MSLDVVQVVPVLVLPYQLMISLLNIYRRLETTLVNLLQLPVDIDAQVIIRESAVQLVLDTLRVRPQTLLFLVLPQEKSLNTLKVSVFLVSDYMKQVPMDILLISILVIISHSGMVRMKLKELPLEVLLLLSQRSQKQMYLKLILLRQTPKRFGIISRVRV